ncbi:MAG TPA: GAF domain-containing protein [Pyrinomonadaceae bacterium]|nr:GAF domain-containing protein [Pyrinomonadaceae bacterium]
MNAPDASDFRNLFERTSDAALVTDDEGARLLAANRALSELTGLPAEKLSDLTLDALLEFEDEGGASPSSDGGVARLLTDGGGEGARVRVERLPCVWDGRRATVCLVRRDAAPPSLDGEKTSALLGYLQEAAEQLEVVNRVVAAVNSSRTIDEVFSLAGEQMRSLVPFDRASIALCEPDCERLRVFALAGEQTGSLSVGALGPVRGSVTELALKEHRMVVIPEVQTETRFNTYDDLLRDGFRSAVCCPLFSTSRAIGSLNLTSRTPDAYERKHLLALERLAPPLAIAIEKMLLYEQAERSNEELRGLYEISRTFSTLNDTSEISGRLASAIAKLTGGQMCLIATFDRRNNLVRAEPFGYNTSEAIIREFQFKLERENKDAPVYLTGEPFFSNDPERDPRFNLDFAARHQIRSVLSVPMRINRELIGFIYVANREGGFGEGDLRLLEIFAAQAAETIVNARLFTTIQAQAEREAVVNRLLLSLQRSGEPKEKINAVIERVGQVLGLDRCVAVLFADGDHEDFYGEWCAEGVEAVTGWRDVRERSPLRYALRTSRRPLHAEDVREHPLAAGFEDLIERASLRSLLVVPVIHQGRVIGSISGHQTRRKRRWTEDDVDLLMAVATHVGATLENARLISELREASRLKDEFLATLSHELKTPLTAITGWVDLLKENAAVRADEEASDGLDAIGVAAHSLTRLISDLLDLSRIQRGVLRLEHAPVDINHAVRKAVRAVRHSAAARGLELREELSDGLPLMVADAQRVQQVLWNLLANAIKFTPSGGSVTLRSRLVGDGPAKRPDAPGRQWVELEVEDTGEGISRDFLPFIWDRFRQADSSATRRHGGLGIGLALVRELVEAHGGGVGVVSEGRGAKFTVRLPVIEAEDWARREPRVDTPVS